MNKLPENLMRIFDENAHRAWLIESTTGTSYTYGEALDAACGGVRALQTLGVDRGDRVGIDLPNCAEFALLYLSCLLGGIIAVPINSALAVRDRDFILEKSDLKLLLTEGINSAKAAPYKTGFVQRGNRSIVDHSGNEISLASGCEAGLAVDQLSRIDPENLFSINFTSGTTSLPKGVPHKVGALLGNAAAFNRTFDLSSDRRFLHVMPMAYMAGFLNTLLCPLMAGAATIIAPQFSAASALRFWKPVTDHHADTLWLTPTMLATLNRIDRSQDGIEYCRVTPSLRIFSATAPLPLKTRQEFELKYSAKVVESYGLSELLLITANLGRKGMVDGSVGVALPEVEIEIRDEQGGAVPMGIEGIIFVRSPFGTIGYLDYATGQPAPNTEAWFDTGDIGIFEDDYLYVTGRRKDLIIRGGFNISPRAIEEVLHNHPDVNDVAVIGVPHEFLGEEVVAAISMHEGRSLAAVEAVLRIECQETLGKLSVPDRFVEIPRLPLSTTGKIQKNILRNHISMGSAL